MTRAPVTDAFGEPVRRVRDATGAVTAIRVGGGGYIAEEGLGTQIYGAAAPQPEQEVK